MSTTIREIFNRCEFCYNSSDLMTWTVKGTKEVVRVPGDRIAYELVDENNYVISERCDAHFTPEECEGTNWREC